METANTYKITLHKLKTWPEYFDRVKAGWKKFEVRLNDRNYQTGDEVLFEEWNPITNEYTGNICHFRIGYILKGGQFGIESGYVVFGIERI